jgi:hypothetical protein
MARADEPFDPVQKPRHYNSHPSSIECIELAHYYSFALGNVVKYCWRSGLKDETPSLIDLAKAEFYLKYAATEGMQTHQRADYRIRAHCEDVLRKVVPHHDGAIAMVLQSITEAMFCGDERLHQALLQMALTSLQMEIMKQQAPIERELTT